MNTIDKLKTARRWAWNAAATVNQYHQSWGEE